MARRSVAGRRTPPESIRYTCEVCSGSYHPPAWNAKTCSDECRKIRHRDVERDYARARGAKPKKGKCRVRDVFQQIPGVCACGGRLTFAVERGAVVERCTVCRRGATVTTRRPPNFQRYDQRDRLRKNLELENESPDIEDV